MTKKDYELYLNKLVKHWQNGRYHATKRPYGTYLRSADPDMFNRGYKEWLVEQNNNLIGD